MLRVKEEVVEEEERGELAGHYLYLPLDTQFPCRITRTHADLIILPAAAFRAAFLNGLVPVLHKQMQRAPQKLPIRFSLPMDAMMYSIFFKTTPCSLDDALISEVLGEARQRVLRRPFTPVSISHLISRRSN